MGMYTEFYINVDLIESTPREVVETVKAMCEYDDKSPYLSDKPSRWCMLFGNGSYYTPYTCVANMTFDTISGQWSLLGKGDTKNYGEIEEFIEYIKPWCENHFIGYTRYEEDEMPTLITQ